METLNAYASLAASLATVLGVVVLIWQVWTGQRQIVAALTQSNKERSLAFFNEFRDDIRSSHFEVLKAFDLKNGSRLTRAQIAQAKSNRELNGAILFILSKYERLGVGYVHGLYSPDLIYDSSGSHLLSMYAIYYNYLATAAQKNSSAYENFLKLVQYIRTRRVSEGKKLPKVFLTLSPEQMNSLDAPDLLTARAEPNSAADTPEAVEK